jgi:hypothetical protein
MKNKIFCKNMNSLTLCDGGGVGGGGILAIKIFLKYLVSLAEHVHISLSMSVLYIPA